LLGSATVVAATVLPLPVVLFFFYLPPTALSADAEHMSDQSPPPVTTNVTVPLLFSLLIYIDLGQGLEFKFRSEVPTKPAVATGRLRRCRHPT